MENLKKSTTAAGKPVARWTMVVTFRKEYQRCNHATGEVIQSWTYRSDLVEQEFATKKNQTFATPLHALAAKLYTIKNRCSEVKVYDNSLPPSQQLIYHELNGEEIFNRKRT